MMPRASWPVRWDLEFGNRVGERASRARLDAVAAREDVGVLGEGRAGHRVETLLSDSLVSHATAASSSWSYSPRYRTYVPRAARSALSY